MKVFICLAAFVAVASAGHLGGYGEADSLVSTGTSSQFRSEDNYGNYNFGYDEQHATGGTSRRESQVNGVRHGSYALNDADGRRRMVNYVADAAGFRATVDTNEPGVEPKDPAAVLINKNGYAREGYGAGPVAAPIAPVAPVFATPAALPIAGPAFRGHVAGPVYQEQAPLPVPVAGPVYGGHVVEGPAYAETPRAFSYSFGSTHVAPVAAYQNVAPVAAYQNAAPVAAYHNAGPIAGPVYQDRLAY